MINTLKQKIVEYNDIIILRHNRPDLDALGSQIGLAETLKYNYPDKNIYVCGDMNERLSFIGKMDEVSDEQFEKSLVIICDVAVKQMMCDPRYEIAKEVFIIDHHKNPSDITSNTIIDPTKAAAAQYIAEILINDWKLTVPPFAATALYGGIVSDSGRFQYSDTTPSTFIIAAKLLELGADMQFIYDNLYVETLEAKQMKGYFSSIFKITKNNVAYLKNDKDIYQKFPVDFFTISRGMVNVMAGIEGINIWCNFTYDPEKDTIGGEFRSRGISIVDIAKEFGGGGHDQACGATLHSWEEVDQILERFNERAKEFNNETHN